MKPSDLPMKKNQWRRISLKNTENLICYVDDGKTINWCETVVHDIFVYHVASDIEINTDNDPEP